MVSIYLCALLSRVFSVVLVQLLHTSSFKYWNASGESTSGWILTASVSDESRSSGVSEV